MSSDFKKQALDYHSQPPAGKISVTATKPCETQRDLALAYSPGVAEPVREIANDPEAAYHYTAKGNLVGVITDGSAVLGLGNVGPLAGKPVMEGKGVLFKKFANIDVFDIEVQAKSPEEFVETVERIAATFGGINLEDIAAPHCFLIEDELIERLDIPVFHDDQHGTAIIIGAGLLNALELQGKSIDTAKIVCVGAGAAGIASLRLLVALGARKENIALVDRKGLVRSDRDDLNVFKREFAVDSKKSTLADVMHGADVFIGVSGPDIVSPEMLAVMAPKPVVFALSNPEPEIKPSVANSVRDDLVMATGRSDFPNQVNNVLGFPYIFRGALDTRATRINQAMQIAAVHALAALAREPITDEVLRAYRLEKLEFGPDYFIPKPLDTRLMEYLPPAVARAAIESGVARHDYPNWYPKR